MIRHLAIFSGALLFAASVGHAVEDRDTRVRRDRSEVEATGLWTYNDLAKGFSEAARSGKPLLVVIRCVP